MNENEKSENSQPYSKVKLFFRWFLVVTAWIAGWVIGLALIIWLLYRISRFLNPAISDPAQFITANLLNALIFAAIVAQVLIYRKQWGAMAQGLEIERAKTDPRLRVADIRVQNFEAGKSPVFLVTIANGGLIDATDVRLRIGIRMDEDKAVDWIDEQIVTIPARGQEVYPIFSSSQLEQQHIDGFNSTVPLKVVGHFTYSPIGRKEFCYKYQPRNVFGLPQFAPCDFQPRHNTTLTVGTAHLKVTGHAVKLIHKTLKGEIQPSGELGLDVKKRETKDEDKKDEEKPN